MTSQLTSLPYKSEVIDLWRDWSYIVLLPARVAFFMKISKINIKNFKSIDLLQDFEINDDKVCCFIGQNGSGKSNILTALNALKHDDDLINENRYEKSNKSELIEIGARILFDEDDDTILEPYGISKNLQGFDILVKKSVGNKPTREFQPFVFDDKTEDNISTGLSKIRSLINKTETTPEEAEQKKSILDSLKLEGASKGNPKSVLGKTYEFYTAHSQDDDNKAEMKRLVDDVIKNLDFDLAKIIEKEIWPNLSIILLDPNTYQVENFAPESELGEDTAHKFLYDLLSLSGKSVKDLDIKGSGLVNVLSDISEELSENLRSVWQSHKLSVVISKQAEQIVFMFKTPQGRSLELTNLSEGQRWFLRFYTALAISKQKGQKVIWLLDEPGQTLHASSQINLKDYFEDVSENSQIFYTTHQPMMIPWHKLERIFLVENIKESGTTIPDRLWKDNELESPLREALALFVGEELLTGTQHVLVEGPSDYIYLQGWLRFFQNTRNAIRWDENYSITNRSFVPTGGSGPMPLYLLFLTHRTKHLVLAVAVPDTSTDENIVKGKIKVNGMEPLTQRVISFETVLKDDKNLKIVGVEDIFEIGEYLKEVLEFYNAKYPNITFYSNFTSPNKDGLKGGVCKYIYEQLKGKNPTIYSNPSITFDKPGVALYIYKKLIHTREDIFSVKTKKRFEKILGEIDKEFKKLVSVPPETLH